MTGVASSRVRCHDVLKTITSTAEHAFALMLCCLRKLPFAFDAVRRGAWTRGEFRGREVAGIDVLANELQGDTASDPLVRYSQENRNLIITPHIGGFNYDAQEKAHRHTARKLVSFFEK